MAQFGHLISGAAWAVTGKVVQFLLSLVTLAVIARLIGPQAYGVYALGWLMLGLFDILVGGAPADTLIQRKTADPGHFNATFWASLGLALVGVLVVWLSADVVSAWLSGGALLAAILPVRALIFVMRAVAVGPTARLMRDSRFRAIAKAEMLASIVSNLVGVGMAVAGAGIWSLVGMELSRALVLTVGVYALARWRPGLQMRLSHFTDLLAFNAATWGAWGLGYVESQLPRLLIASALGPQAVGYYALAQRLCEQVSDILMTPAYNVVQAGIARAQHDIANARRLAAGTLRVTAVVACPLFLGLAALAPILVPTVFGAAWVEAVPVVQLLMLLGIRSSMSIVQAAVVRGMGKAHWEMLSATVSVVTAAALIGLVAPYGLIPAATAVVVSAWLVWPLDAALVRRLTDLSIAQQGAAGSRAALSAVAMAVFVMVLAPVVAGYLPPVAAMAVLVPIGAVAYWAMLRVFMPAAAAVIEHVVMSLARRDFGAIRASLGSFSA